MTYLETISNFWKQFENTEDEALKDAILDSGVCAALRQESMLVATAMMRGAAKVYYQSNPSISYGQLWLAVIHFTNYCLIELRVGNTRAEGYAFQARMATRQIQECLDEIYGQPVISINGLESLESDRGRVSDE